MFELTWNAITWKTICIKVHCRPGAVSCFKHLLYNSKNARTFKLSRYVHLICIYIYSVFKCCQGLSHDLRSLQLVNDLRIVGQVSV